MTEPRIHIFAGPSLPPDVRPADDRFRWHPPAAAGDCIALLDALPARVCLIDGFFDSCAAPWHKELLLLIENGAILFGAASMGALRAAELDPFGMIGVGAIYQAYRGGRLHGDDEVALIHAPARLGWAPLSVPMVEVRATLVAGCRAGVVAAAAARKLRAIAQEIYFEDRDWPMLVRQWQSKGGVDAAVSGRLRQMHVPLKQHDALACLAAARVARKTRAISVSTPRTCFIDALAARSP